MVERKPTLFDSLGFALETNVWQILDFCRLVRGTKPNIADGALPKVLSHFVFLPSSANCKLHRSSFLLRPFGSIHNSYIWAHFNWFTDSVSLLVVRYIDTMIAKLGRKRNDFAKVKEIGVKEIDDGSRYPRWMSFGSTDRFSAVCWALPTLREEIFATLGKTQDRHILCGWNYRACA